MRPQRRIRYHRGCSFIALGFLTLMAAGCSADSASNPTPSSVPPTESDDSAPVAPLPESTSSTENDSTSTTKWIGKIPYDVFYDQPLVVAADATSLAPTIGSSGDNPPPEMATPPPGETPQDSVPSSDAAAADGPDWAELIRADVLNEAVTTLRNRLTTNLNTLATYNSNTETIANDGAILAALAAVAEVHPESVSWQDNARFVRDLGYLIYMSADGKGRDPFNATKEPFESIVAILNGGPPPDIDSEARVPMADIADRSELMKRIKQSYDFLRAEINTEARFQESPEDIVREASMLASFGGMISTDSYESADEEMYRQFVRDFMQANIDVVAATQANDFARFEESRNRIQKACDACHAEYAFGTDSF